MILQTPFMDIPYDNCYLKLDNYANNNSLCISIYNNDGPICRLTTNLSNHEPLPKDYAYVDVNNCPFAPHFIEHYKLGFYTEESYIEGFCIYPLYKFNMDVLLKYAKEGNNE